MTYEYDEFGFKSGFKPEGYSGKSDYKYNYTHGWGGFSYYPEGSSWYDKYKFFDYKFKDKIEKLEELMPEFKKIKTHPFLELAKQSNVFLIDKKIYLRSVKKKESLIELFDLDFLDTLMFEKFAKELEGAKKSYSESFEKQMVWTELLNAEESIPKLIFEQIMPYFRGKSYDDKLDDLLGDDVCGEVADCGVGDAGIIGEANEVDSKSEKRANELATKVVKEFKHQILKLNREKLEKDDPKIIDFSGNLSQRVFEGKNMAFLDGIVYDLISDDELKDKCGEDKFEEISKVSFDGKNYSLKKSSLSFNKLEKLYKFNLGKLIKTEVLKNDFTKEKIKQIVDKLENEFFTKNDVKGTFKNSTNYAEEDFGFFKHEDGDYYIYINVPAYAVKSVYDDNYFLFKKTRIGCRMSMYKGKLDVGYSYLMFENNGHPILHRQKEDFAHLCPGSNKLPDEKNLGEKLAKTLRKYRDIIMYGYLNGTYIRCEQFRAICESCGKNHYSKQMRSLEELQKLGVPIFEKKEGCVEGVEGEKYVWGRYDYFDREGFYDKKKDVAGTDDKKDNKTEHKGYFWPEEYW